jgi:DNA polymerase III subunit delta'
LQQSEYKCFSWHDSLWRELWAPASGLPHALLLTGSEGIGKSAFAIGLAARLLCESPAARTAACGGCPSCRWFAAGNHPDYRYVIPGADVETEGESAEGEKKKASRQIRIDQIRALEDFVFVGAHRDGARVVVIEPAEAMNIAAANSLLKILEEPPSSVYFILISSRWRRLLPTIRSRCRVLKLPRPPLAEAKEWLAAKGDREAAELLPLVGGAPLLAIEESERGRSSVLAGVVASLADPGRDPLALAARWESHLQTKGEGGLPMETLVGVLQKWVADLAQCKLAGRSRYHSAKGMAGSVEEASATGLIRCYNELVRMRALASHPLNPRLFLEEMAARYLRSLANERGAEHP